MSIGLNLLQKLRCRILAKGTGQPLPGVVVHLSIPVDRDMKGSLPVSTLRTDATGYVSFDLQPLTELGLDMVPAIHVSAPQVGLKNHDVLEQLKGSADSAWRADSGEMRTSYLSSRGPESGQRRAPICIEFPIHVDQTSSAQESSEVLCQVDSLASVQRPDVCDYELSPYSFVTPVKINMAGECCESLAPSTLPVQEHLFYRVIVRRISDDGTDSVQTSIDRSVDITKDLPKNLPETRLAIKFAEVLDYRQRWFAIGHSLGEIKYSLPLAPGESTQLAVIEWSRTDTASRFDSVTGKEDLTHWLKRDRTIEETIDAGLKESQGGWSWTFGLSSGMTYDAKQYGQYTGNWAAGGGTSYSWGQRKIEGDSQQELHDAITQSTSYTRSLNSTVIVQASQAEANNVRTRRVANHNHCHALTIQYYEVLRHFRLETAFVGRRYAVLIPFSTFKFDLANTIRFRYALEQALIDRSLLSYFDAVVRLKLDDEGLHVYGPVATTTESKYFVGDLSNQIVDAAHFPMYPDSHGKRLLIEKGSTLTITAQADGGKINFGSGELGNADVDGKGPPATDDDSHWYLADVPGWALIAMVGPKYYPVGRGNTFTALEEGELSLWFNVRGAQNANVGRAIATVTVRAPAKAAPPDTVKVPVDSLSPQDADKMKAGFLLKHLNANSVYYNRAVWMLMDAADRRLHLEAALGSNSPILAAIDDKPIAVSGNHVAFAYDGPLPFTPEAQEKLKPLESIVTLPTRGLFAEAQLGHCNSCEKRDITRMWNWTEMTTEEPPAISGIQPGPHGQTPTLTPTALPSNVIQIAQPPAAPDPTGLANALKLLGTPNIFRDMSGLAEASALLGKLADGTIKSLDDMAKTASQAKAKLDAIRNGQTGTGTSAGTSGSNGASPKGRTQPNEKDAGAQVDRLQVIEDAKQRNLISDQEAKDAMRGLLGGEMAPDTSSPGVQYVSSDAGVSTLPSAVVGKALVGDPNGQLDLAQAVEAHLNSLGKCNTGLCVEASASYFTDAMKKLGVPFDVVQAKPPELPVEMPVIAAPDGTHVVPRTLVTIWFSNGEANNWTKIPKLYRGRGAPGALHYANLTEDIKTSETGWPMGMKPGAFLQLWPDKAAFDELLATGATPPLGHSCVFRRYVLGSPNKIIVADQTSLTREATYPMYDDLVIGGLKFVIAGNLSKAKLIEF